MAGELVAEWVVSMVATRVGIWAGKLVVRMAACWVDWLAAPTAEMRAEMMVA